MVAIREDEFETFLKRRASAMNGILIHGADSSAVSTLGQSALRAIAGVADASFALVRIDVASLKENAGGLSDEFRSLSLLGERRVLMVEGVDDGHLKYLLTILDSREVGNFIVLLADALGKSSKLRSAIEASEKFASLAIYEEDSAALALRIRNQLGAEKFTWTAEAQELFFALVGVDRSAAVQEATKLALYCVGQSLISEDDVEAVCGDSAAFGSDELIDAVLAGDLERTDRMASNLGSDSAGTRGILLVFNLHFSKLQALRMDMERGLNADMAVRNARPAIFFKRRTAVINQLRNFDLDDLVSMQTTVANAIFQTRKLPDLFEAITSRTLLSLSRNARSKSQ
jgi:DNA polymerase III subunit delta